MQGSEAEMRLPCSGDNRKTMKPQKTNEGEGGNKCTSGGNGEQVKSLVGHSKDFGFYSEFNGKSLESFEQKRPYLP